jgi:D-sedoheptulose 7-phosphate isomerase
MRVLRMKKIRNSSRTNVSRRNYIRQQCIDSARVKLGIIEKCSPDVQKATSMIIKGLRDDKKLLICGNGGSAADAQHIATELVIRMTRKNRPPMAAIALTTDTSMLTAGGNDIGFKNIFSRQVEALGHKGDILIAISTSGMSENVVFAAKTAKKQGMQIIGLLGKKGGKLKSLVDVPIIIPSDDTQRIQEGHITVAHIICGILEDEMFR